jgi:hypothetical protein
MQNHHGLGVYEKYETSPNSCRTSGYFGIRPAQERLIAYLCAKIN